MRRWGASIAIVVLGLVGAAVVPASSESADGASALDRALARLVAGEGDPPGAIALVQRDGQVSVHRAGVADVVTGRPMSAGDSMRLASVSKAYSGAVALALVDRGGLSLDDTIGDRLPDLPEAWAGISLRELLNHTSGLPDYLESPELLERLAADPTAYIPPDELLPYAYDEPVRVPPGERYQYSNSDNIAVALMVEAATGRSYEAELAARVFEPLGLEETSLPIVVELPVPFIHGYELVPGEAPEDLSEVLNPSGAWASGGIVSTSRELDRFFRGYLGRKLFGRATQDEQLKLIPGGASDPRGPGENAAGLGIYRYRTRCGTVYGHAGNFPGYTQFAAATRDGSRSVTVSINIQLRPDLDPAPFARLLEVEELAVCAALAPSGPTRLPTLVRVGR